MRFFAILVFGALSAAPILALPTSTGPHKGCFDDPVTPSCRLLKSRVTVPSFVEVDTALRDLEMRKCNPTEEHCHQHDTRDGEERMKEEVKAREPEGEGGVGVAVVAKALPCKPLPQGGCGPPGLE